MCMNIKRMKPILFVLLLLTTLFSFGQHNKSNKKNNYYDTLNFKRCCHNCGEIDYCVLDSIYKCKKPYLTDKQINDDDNYFKTRKKSWIIRKGLTKKTNLNDYVGTHYYHRLMNQKIHQLKSQIVNLDTLIVYDGEGDSDYCMLDSSKHECLLQYQLTTLHLSKIEYPIRSNSYHKQLFEEKFSAVKVLVFANPVGCCDTIYDTTNLFLYHFPFHKFTSLETIIITGNDADMIVDLPYTTYPKTLKEIQGYCLRNQSLFEKNIKKHLQNVKLNFDWKYFDNAFYENYNFDFLGGNIRYYIYRHKIRNSMIRKVFSYLSFIFSK